MREPVRIDDKTHVPLGAVIALFSAGISISVAGTLWIAGWQSQVNLRLSRIEDRLGIARAPAATKFFANEVSWNSQGNQQANPVGSRKE